MATSDPVMIIDLQGRCFDISQDFIDKYPNSVLAKSLMVANGKECSEPIKIDRGGKHFSKILEYARGEKKAFNFSQMSHIDIKELIKDLDFFGLDDCLMRQCRRELGIVCQESIEVAPSEKHLKNMLSDETRLVIILNADFIASNSSQSLLMRSMKQIDRDKCLMVGCRGDIAGYSNISRKHNFDSFLCDPVTWKMLQANYKTQESDLKHMIYRANTRPSHLLYKRLYSSNITDLEKELAAFNNLLYVSLCD